MRKKRIVMKKQITARIELPRRTRKDIFHDMYLCLPCFQSQFLILSHSIRESPLMKRHFLKNTVSPLQQLHFKYYVETILDDFDDFLFILGAP